MCIRKRVSFIRKEALKPFSLSAELSTQLFAEDIALVQVRLLLETVFTSPLCPLPLHPSTYTYVSSPTLTSLELDSEDHLISGLRETA